MLREKGCGVCVCVGGGGGGKVGLNANAKSIDSGQPARTAETFRYCPALCMPKDKICLTVQSVVL